MTDIATNIVFTPCPNLSVRQTTLDIPWRKTGIGNGGHYALWLQAFTCNTETGLSVYMDATHQGKMVIPPEKANAGLRINIDFLGTPDRFIMKCENGEYIVRQLALMRAEEMDAAFAIAPFGTWYKSLLSQ